MDESWFKVRCAVALALLTAVSFSVANDISAADARRLRALLSDGWKDDVPVKSISTRLKKPVNHQANEKIVIVFSGEPSRTDRKLSPTLPDRVSLKSLRSVGPAMQLPKASDIQLKDRALQQIAIDHGFGVFGSEFLEMND